MFFTFVRLYKTSSLYLYNNLLFETVVKKQKRVVDMYFNYNKNNKYCLKYFLLKGFNSVY